MALRILDVPPVEVTVPAISQGERHRIEVTDHLQGRYPESARIGEATIDNGSRQDVQVDERGSTIRATDRPTLRFPNGAWAITLSSPNGDIGSDKILVELVLGVPERSINDYLETLFDFVGRGEA